MGKPRVNRRRSLLAVAIAVAVSLLLGAVMPPFLLRKPSTAVPKSLRPVGTVRRDLAEITVSNLETAIHKSAKYLAGSTTESGRFVYKINLDSNVKVQPQYNVLRHAGTIYALAQYHRRYPSDETRQSLLRAARYLKQTCIAPVPEKPDLLAVWTKPEITGNDAPVQAKLGGAGLALVALLSLEEVAPGTTPVEELRRLGRFVLFMQKPDGGFYSKYIPSEGGRSDRWTSLYYPGEAALGLLMLYEQDPSPAWLQGTADGIAYLARRRQGQRQVEADHWALLATAKLLPHYQHCQPPISREAVIAHARQICQSMLAHRAEIDPRREQFGGFSPDGRTCPTATRLEGLLAALTFLPEGDRELHDRMRRVIREGIDFLLRAQVPSGSFAGAMPRAIRPLAARHPLASRHFNRRATEVRIDYVQHALSAMLEFDRLILRGEATGRSANDEG